MDDWMDKADAEREAKREEWDQWLEAEVKRVIDDEQDLYLALKGWGYSKEVQELYGLLSLLVELGASLDSYPVEPLMNEQIIETVDALSVQVQKIVKHYIEAKND